MHSHLRKWRQVILSNSVKKENSQCTNICNRSFHIEETKQMYHFTLLNVLKHVQFKLQINCSHPVHVQIPSPNHFQWHNNMPWKKQWQRNKGWSGLADTSPRYNVMKRDRLAVTTPESMWKPCTCAIQRGSLVVVWQCWVNDSVWWSQMSFPTQMILWHPS